MAGFRDLIIYQKAFEVSRKVFTRSRRFPAEEKYSLTDQCRRSSRSVTAQIGEAYRHRHYPAYFVSKLTNADGENTETQIWLDHAVECGYAVPSDIEEIRLLSEEVGRLLGDMIEHPGKWCLPPWKF